VTFSAAALSQVHWPAGRARHEHRGPVSSFSAAALAQVQCRAEFWPHEQVACLAVGNRGVSDMAKRIVKISDVLGDVPQAHSVLPLPQQVEDLGTVMLIGDLWLLMLRTTSKVE
jgi:hypothetical protein